MNYADMVWLIWVPGHLLPQDGCIEPSCGSCVSFVFPANTNREPDPDFFRLKPSPKGNDPSKFQLIRIRRFVGVREQTINQTHRLTH